MTCSRFGISNPQSNRYLQSGYGFPSVGDVSEPAYPRKKAVPGGDCGPTRSFATSDTFEADFWLTHVLRGPRLLPSITRIKPGSILEGEPNSFTLDLAALGLSAGTYYVGAIADDDEDVSESNEGNNVSNVVQVTIVTQSNTAPTRARCRRRPRSSWSSSSLGRRKDMAPSEGREPVAKGRPGRHIHRRCRRKPRRLIRTRHPDSGIAPLARLTDQSLSDRQKPPAYFSCIQESRSMSGDVSCIDTCVNT